MSLATRCTSCGTVFRVAEDQLRVSDGWVRCGRCEAVFNAAESLLELEQAAAMARASASPRARPAPPEPEPEPDLPEPLWDRRNALNPPPPPASPDWSEAGARFDTSAGPEAAGAAPQHWDDDEAQQAAFDQRREPQLHAHEAEEPRGSQRGAPAPHRGLAADAGTEEPPRRRTEKPALRRGSAGESTSGAANTEFMRRAAVRARWRQPAVVQGLALLLAIMTLALALQVAHHQRDMLAARWPAATGALQAWCAVAGCQINPPQRIDDLVVDSATLAQLGPNSQAVKLNVNLRNRGATRVAMPAIDLTLTDSNGKPVLRKALMVSDFQPIQGGGLTLAPGGEQALGMVFKVSELSYTGYHVEIFYP